MFRSNRFCLILPWYMKGQKKYICLPRHTSALRGSASTHAVLLFKCIFSVGIWKGKQPAGVFLYAICNSFLIEQGWHDWVHDREDVRRAHVKVMVVGMKLQNHLLVFSRAAPAEHGFHAMLLAQCLFRLLPLSQKRVRKKKSVCMKSICNYHTVQHISTDIATVLSLCSDNSIFLVLCFSYNNSTKGTLMPGSPDARIWHYFTTNMGVNTIDLWCVQCTLLDSRTTQSFFLLPWVRLWEEMVNIPCFIDPNCCRTTQQGNVCIDQALELQNKCVLCSKADVKDPWGWLKQEKGLSLQGRRMNPEWQADPASSTLFLGWEVVATPRFAFSICSALRWNLFPLLVGLWASRGCCWVLSQKGEKIPTQEIPLSPAQNKT